MSDRSVPDLPARAAFVVGMKRSGTSLVKALLEGHPQVMALPRETKTFRWRDETDPVAGLFRHSKFSSAFPEGTEERATLEAALRERLSGPTDTAPAVRAVAEAVALVRPPAAGAEVWVEKTPDHLLHTEELLEAFGPETRFVCLVRDPRAQMASRKFRWKRKIPFRPSRFARKWIGADDRIRRLDERLDAFLVIRYEDVVRDTRGTMERVAAHLGLPWDDRLLVPVRDEEAWRGNSSYTDKPEGITTRSLDLYLARLDEAEIRRLEAWLGPRMEARGYELRFPRARRSLRRAWLETRARFEARRER